jgi:peroxiredoxin
MRTRLGAVGLSAVLAAGAAWAGARGAAKIGEPAPSFALKDQDGKTVRLSSLRGKVVVLEWVNPDCPIWVRHAEAKTMKTLEERYRDRGVVWLGINTTHYMTAEHDAKARGTYGLAYPILRDPDGTVGRLYGAKTTPHMYVIAKDGTLVYRGAIDNDPSGDAAGGVVNYVAAALDEILAGKPVTVADTKPYGCSVKYKK